MLIKLQESADSLRYIIIDNARNIRYEVCARHYSDHKEFDEDEQREYKKYTGPLRTETRYQYTHDKPIPMSAPLARNLIRYESPQNAEVYLWFDGEAYICNDDGKTIQRVNSI